MRKRMTKVVKKIAAERHKVRSKTHDKPNTLNGKVK